MVQVVVKNHFLSPSLIGLFGLAAWLGFVFALAWFGCQLGLSLAWLCSIGLGPGPRDRVLWTIKLPINIFLYCQSGDDEEDDYFLPY